MMIILIGIEMTTSFDLHFSNTVISNVDHIFMSFFDHLCVFFEEMSI